MRVVTRVGRSLGIALLALVIGLVAPALAKDLPWERESLAGLAGVLVLVEGLNPDVERQVVTQSTLQTDVEVKLRQVGIRVLTETEWLAAPGSPSLSVAVDAVSLSLGEARPVYAVVVRLELSQKVALHRNPVIALRAPTWRTGSIVAATAGKVDKVREYVRDKVDEFINAYLAANPKR